MSIKKIVSSVKGGEKLLNIASHAYFEYRNRKNKLDYNKRIEYIKQLDILNCKKVNNLNIVIITVDCLRNCQLSCNNCTRETTPFLDSFKIKIPAFSASSWTYPSVASILTGLYPHNHNAIIDGKIKMFHQISNWHALRKSVITLPEILYLSGYKIFFGTHIDFAYWAVKDRVNKNYCGNTKKAEDALYHMGKWIKKQRNNFFAYLQLGDLHEPVDPPGNYKNFFGNVNNFSAVTGWDYGEPVKQQGNEFNEYKYNKFLLHDNTLRYVDHAIENFYLSLKKWDLLDSTIFIVTADHGEEFWEHAFLENGNFYDQSHGIGHGHNFFNEVIQVPLLMYIPDQSMSGLNRLISTVDIVPTLLDLLEIDHNIEFDGLNMFNNTDDRTLLSEAAGIGYEKKALINDKYKLLFSHDDNIAWVFDLENDPRELHPITDHEIVSTMTEKLEEIYKKDYQRKLKKTIEKRSIKN